MVSTVVHAHPHTNSRTSLRGIIILRLPTLHHTPITCIPRSLKAVSKLSQLPRGRSANKMQQTLPRPCNHCKCGHDVAPAQHSFSGTRLPAQPAQRKRSARVAPTAFSGALNSTASFSNIASLSNIASATVFALGALWLSRSEVRFAKQLTHREFEVVVAAISF